MGERGLHTLRLNQGENSLINFYLKAHEGWERREAQGDCCVLLPVLRQEATGFGPSKSSPSMERSGDMPEVKTAWKHPETPDKLNLDKPE